MYPDPAPSQVATTAASGGLDEISSESVNEPQAEESSHQDSPPRDTSWSLGAACTFGRLAFLLFRLLAVRGSLCHWVLGLFSTSALGR